MLTKHKSRANVAVWVRVGSFLWTAVTGLSSLGSGNIFDNGNIPAIAFEMKAIAAFLYAVWAYLKAKGRSAFWMLAPPFGSVIGRLVRAALEDRHPEEKAGSKGK